ncbi:hypothetical protein C8R44DRAFT_863453 [Mycena epipterygia]|nr:hypothetical protein C8R44DRAFT_863453 [Mycena epipterygia]
MALNDVPMDILMEIAGQLDLPDSLQLVATCSTCRNLAGEQYFWIMALNRMENLHRRSLPCPPGTDITSLPLATFQEFAIHAYKLRKNWASEFPQAVSVRRLVTEPNLLKFCPIDGSHLLLTLSATRLACWNSASGECVAAFNHPELAKASWAMISNPSPAPRECSIGIVYPRYSPEATLEIAVLQIDHHGPVVTISKVFSKNWTAPDLESLDVSHVAMSEKMIAVVFSTRRAHSQSDFLLFCGFGDTIIHRIPLGSNENATFFQALIYGDDIYLSRQHFFDPFVELGLIHTSAAPNDLGMVTKKLDIPFSVPRVEEVFLIGGSNPRHPKYGILDVTMRSSAISPDDDVRINSLHFWPAEIPGSPSGVINVQPLCFYEHPLYIYQLGVGSSGTCAVIVDDAETLGLVQYTMHPTTHITFRPLRLHEVEVDHQTETVLDDRLGIVYIQHPTQRDITIISYA